MKHLLTAAALALLASATSAEAQTTDDEWRFRLTPYIWLAGITGDTGSDGVDLPRINPGYQFFTAENFDGVAFLAFAARKGQWAVHNDLVYISFADTLQTTPVEASFDLNGGTFELSGGYRPKSWQNTEVIFGARAVKLSLDAVLSPGPTGSDARSFVDPIIGVNYEQTFENRWGAKIRGDIGGGASNLMANAILAGTYRFTDVFTLIFGYRYLKIDFEEDDFLVDISVQGYSFGFEFDW